MINLDYFYTYTKKNFDRSYKYELRKIYALDQPARIFRETDHNVISGTR